MQGVLYSNQWVTKSLATKAPHDKIPHRQKPHTTKAHTDKSSHIQQKCYFRNINKAY